MLNRKRPKNGNKGSNPQIKKPFALHNLSVDELKQIKKETRNIKPLYACGNFVYLRKKIEQDGYIIPKHSLCSIEQVTIRLQGTELREKNNYKIYYYLLHEYPDSELFSGEEELDLRRDLQPEPEDGYIMFEVEENDIGDYTGD